jgi:transglutaminase-like putative cysteine protease
MILLLLFVATASGAMPSKDAWTQPARYRFAYVADFSKLAESKPGKLRVWLPYPPETKDQKIVAANIESPWPHRITSDALGNKIVYLEGDGVPPSPVTMSFTVERAPSAGIPASDASGDKALDPQRYLHSDKLIPLQGVIENLAKEQSRGLDTDAKKVRAFYDYVVRNMSYNKDGTGWGRGDAIWACANKRGNCTDFHSLFIGMARSEKIPARFVIGIPIPADANTGVVPGYHCWAQYYDQTRGWVPLDASEATKSGQPDAYFGTLPNDRIEFSSGRDLELEPPQKGEPLNFFIYPYVEADGTPRSEVTTTFRFEKVAAPAA